ncbi:trypco2 family protein [Vibrio parahaemolyticus]
MEEVELEVSFTLDAKAEGSAKLVVLDVGGNVQASQVHRVKLN